MNKFKASFQVFLLCLAVLGVTLISFLEFKKAELVAAQENTFTAEELSKYDGKDGRPSYFAYKGKVYDVTSSPLWKMGEHYGLQAGQDLSDKLKDAPHGEEVFVAFKVVGIYPASAPAGVAVTSASSATTLTEMDAVAATTTIAATANAQAPQWFEGRIRLFGISVLGWTGILLGVFFILTFGTCFAMPWAKLPLPWKGSKPGTDALDGAPRHLTWSSIHKYFVWITVALGIVHGVIGYMQMLWGMYL